MSTGSSTGSSTGLIALGPEGVLLDDAARDSDDVLDLCVEGRRVWSFRAGDHAVPVVEADPAADPALPATSVVVWPRDLRGFLDGLALVEVRGPDGEVRAAEEFAFVKGAVVDPATLDTDDDGADGGDGDHQGPARVRIEDAHGHPLVVGPNHRLVRTFEARGADALVPLMDSLDTVLEVLNGAGVAAFPAYGTLLGAVRSGHLLAHDDDVDVGYVSTHRTPVDVALESFDLQRLLHEAGFGISRYSGAGFKVEVDTGSGTTIGLDVFGGFFHGDESGEDGGERLALMGEIDTPFRREWILPLGEVELEGRRVPAPAEPERLLEATYGPSWRVPDPAFVYRTPDEVRRRLDGWFRGTRAYRNLWDRRYSTSAHHGPWNRTPHQLARALARREAPGTHVVELGCGRGQDAVWLAKRGFGVTALDYSGNGYAHLSRRAVAEGWDVEFAAGNLLETRQVLAWTAQLSAELAPGLPVADGGRPRAVLARHLLDATSERGRQGAFRLARALLARTGGRMYLEFMTNPDRAPLIYPDGLVHDLDADVVAAEAEAAGARVTVRRLLDPEGYERPSEPEAGSPAPRSCRMVVEWAP